MTYRAWAPEHGDSEDDVFEVRNEGHTARSAAVAAAEHAHGRRDAWEWSWPVTFAVADGTGRVDYFEVDRVMVPEFVADPIVEGPEQSHAEKMARLAAKAVKP